MIGLKLWLWSWNFYWLQIVKYLGNQTSSFLIQLFNNPLRQKLNMDNFLEELKNNLIFKFIEEHPCATAFSVLLGYAVYKTFNGPRNLPPGKYHMFLQYVYQSQNRHSPICVMTQASQASYFELFQQSTTHKKIKTVVSKM